MLFSEFFERATGFAPHPYQARVAAEGLPDLLRVPMGAGKSKAVVLGWLWRRLHGSDEVRRATPRRLAVALPMRTLVDQFETDVQECLDRLGLAAEVGLYVVMGARRSDERRWRIEAHQPSIVVGTIDCLVSKALNRGYGISRNAFPIDFALMTNGTHIVIDEIQLAAASTVTLRQIAGFRRTWPAAEPAGLTCMSATVDRRIINTVDNADDDVVTIALGEPDRHGRLGELLAAGKVVRRMPGEQPSAPPAVAAHAQARHRPGSRTLVVVNTVKSAKAIFASLRRLKPAAEVLLIHSRFRGVERAELARRLIGPVPEAGVIVVATQVVEAGVDLDSSVLITESAPWPSLCQRSGRCNRYAKVSDAELWWFSGSSPGPYTAEDIVETERVLTGLEGEPCTGEVLLAQVVTPGDLALRVLRRPDFLALFDTAPDLSGVDIDVAPFIREGADSLDCQVAWIEVPPKGAPEPGAALPGQAWRCPVPVNEARSWAKSVEAWTLDVVVERWERVRAQTRIRPGELILVAARSGGYNPDVGFDPTSTLLVQGEPPSATDAPSGAEEVDLLSADLTNGEARRWELLDEHLRATRDHAVALVKALDPDLDEGMRRVTVAAAYTHDIGKANLEWQQGLRATAHPIEGPDGLLAKSPGRGRLAVPGRSSFRHELQSALMLGTPEAADLRTHAGITDDDVFLVRYLVAAHHGKVRLQVRQPSGSAGPSHGTLGLRDGELLGPSTVLDTSVEPWVVDLGLLALGGEQSWTRSALELLDRYGPFRLAYLEMLVRVADWRASAGLGLPDGAVR
ncbi:CRISPR-associated helicase Cas3' [uncultured Friedmanniella sp.]|uniref:type I-G CRISPR-associated helicase/endonuclease Cas3g n=1 Tax=uncultured Friedmanniella sp. TaxID=335381 RepID=UPI0035CC498C